VFTGSLTAFYITRAIWLTFHGRPRDPHLFAHAHESPRVMTVPLLALAAGSALVGFIGFPPDNGFLHAFLRPTVEAGTAGGPLAAGSPETTDWPSFLAFAAISTAVGVIGILFGLSMYGRGRPDPAAVARAARPYYDVLVNKYYVDELYDRRFVDVARSFAGAAWAFDIHIIDGLVNRLGWAIRLGGRGLRRAQTGVVGNYALSIVAGLLVILVAYGGYATGWLRR
jgi:NADH-quinone oxidoreductase subunit L